jgi:hypothetical protein
MSRARARAIGCERGAVFVQVGISLFVLMAFNVFVLDYGMMWIARRQAQNAADAGALAGAMARGYDDFGSPPSGSGIAALSAQGVAAANLVWQQAPTPRVLFSCPAGVTGKCVRVEVYRNGQFGSTSIPTLFGPVLGITNQGVKATATAIAGNGNMTTCMKPWALPDEWNENRSPNNEFNAYDAGGAPLSGPDTYTAPSATLSDSYDISGHFGDYITFNEAQPWNSSPITDGFVVPLTLPGGRTYLQDMTSCNGQPIVLGQRLSIDTTIADRTTALNAAVALDASADYNYGDSYVTNSCAPGCAAVSPRLFAVALYDPNDFQRRRSQNDWAACPGGTPCVTVSNIAGFFIHRLSGGGFGRHGHLLKYPGMTATGAPNFADDASWLVTTNLIR